MKWNWIRQHLYAILNERIDTIESLLVLLCWVQKKIVRQNKQIRNAIDVHVHILEKKSVQYFYGKINLSLQHCSEYEKKYNIEVWFFSCMPCYGGV